MQNAAYIQIGSKLILTRSFHRNSEFQIIVNRIFIIDFKKGQNAEPNINNGINIIYKRRKGQVYSIIEYPIHRG